MRRGIYRLLNFIAHGFAVLFVIGFIATVLSVMGTHDQPDLPVLTVDLVRMIIISVIFLVIAILLQWIAFLISPADFEDYNMAQRGRLR